MDKNVLYWYNGKIREIAKQKGYLRNTIINVEFEDDLHGGMELEWLFNNYSPKSYEILYLNDKIKFTQDGTPLHEIAIFLKEIPKI